MPERIMYVHLKTGYNTDRGPAWIARLRLEDVRTEYAAFLNGAPLPGRQNG